MSDSIDRIHTDDAPAAIGPYNQAAGGGGLLFLSGQVALDPATGEMVGAGDVVAETRQVLKNLVAVLAADGLGPADVLRCTVYLVDMADFQAVNALYAEVFGDAPPARACIAVVGLPKGARVEIDAIALRR